MSARVEGDQNPGEGALADCSPKVIIFKGKNK